ncbi:MAG TPA: CDP-glycerol glycerophosphotransferase family protein [Clostridiales bacterium]|nr:CDP-glycerol glycerophosphotransferase family protein [Clostridiales bacterium]
MKTIVKRVMKIPMLLLYHLFILVNRVDTSIILFESNLGRNYSGNPRFIYEELVRRGLDRSYRCYFILEDTSVSLPGSAGKVKRISMLYFYLFAKAGTWVSDTRMPAYLKKRKGTIYIQTWHGTPLKKLGLDLEQVSMAGEKGLEDYKRKFALNSKTWDYLLSQNAYSTRIFRRAFAFDKEILEIGYPRNDILFHENDPGSIVDIKRKLGLPVDKKLLLYAPTWRDNEHYGHLTYRFSSGIDYDYLQEKLSRDYVIIIKAHYLVGEKLDLEKYRGFLYQFGASSDIAELYLVSDMLITDYSSVMFDYSLLRRPMLFYTYDLEQYKDSLRGFYFDFMEEAPGPIVITSEQLVKAIEEYDFCEYQEKYDAFREKYNHADHGDAAKQVVDLICQRPGGKLPPS